VVCQDCEPEKKNSEIMPTEPYLLGSHSGCCGLWTSGPDYDWVPDAYKIKAANGKVYNRMTTVKVCSPPVTAWAAPVTSSPPVPMPKAVSLPNRWSLRHGLC
jgi:hypothetical protein